MAKKKKDWYAWRDAEGNGDVTKTWPECKRASSGRPGEEHQGFETYEEAWVFAHPDMPMPPKADTMPPPQEPTAVPLPQADAQQQMPEPVHLDMSRVLEGQVSESVDRYCEDYGFAHLSREQRRAIQAVRGKYLLFAVPGSGKTTVLVARAGYMVHACRIDPAQMMTMTFTRAAAKEMRDRYLKYFPKDQESGIPDFRTIHSFCMSIVIPKLRRAGYHCPRHVVDEECGKNAEDRKKYSSRAILSAVLKKHGIKKYTDETHHDAASTAFSSIKNREMAPEEYGRYEVRFGKQAVPLTALYDSYQAELKTRNCMDYDDMLVFSLDGLRQHRRVLEELRQRYRYWSVDEAQDNSRIQFELLDLLTGPDGNVFMVGDDDQSIYGFRGAEPGMLLRFGNQPDVHSLLMSTDYRSRADIVRTAETFISRNSNRAAKQMRSSHPDKGMIRVPPGHRCEAGQYAYILNAARQCRTTGKRLGVLYELNVSALPLIVSMHLAGIPFEASKGLKELLNGKLIGSLIRTLRFVDAPTDPKRFFDCCKDLGLWHKCSDEQQKALEEAHRREPETPVLKLILAVLDKNDSCYPEIEKRERVISEAHGCPPAEVVAKLVRGLPSVFGPENLNERLAVYGLLSVCDQFKAKSLNEMLTKLHQMKAQEKAATEKSEADEPEPESDGRVKSAEDPVVSLSTIHSAKGREWDHVIIIDAFDEILPGKDRFDRIGYDSEEARRLFYVAVTRAIERLDIVTVDAYHGNHEQVSSFIPEIACDADMITDEPVETAGSAPEDDLTGASCVIEPARYYSVPIGSQPGVYTDWAEVEELKKGLSIPNELQPKGHDTFEEAWARVFPGQPVPERKPGWARSTIESVIQLSGGSTFNHAVDMPESVRRGLMEHLGCESMQVLPKDRLTKLINESRFSWQSGRTDYHGRVDGYAAAYMAVNFYKIWLPLWKLLDRNALPPEASILELGPGPGTSTWSLVEFYACLARENPRKHFALTYTAVEREYDFETLFNCLGRHMLAGLPENLSVNMNTHFGVDAFHYMAGLTSNEHDMIIESNVMNAQESFNGDAARAYVRGLHSGLKPDGCAVLIEPLESERPSLFSRFIAWLENKEGFACPYRSETAAVNTAGNRLAIDAVRSNIRYSKKTEHRFCYAIIKTREKGNSQ